MVSKRVLFSQQGSFSSSTGEKNKEPEPSDSFAVCQGHGSTCLVPATCITQRSCEALIVLDTRSRGRNKAQRRFLTGSRSFQWVSSQGENKPRRPSIISGLWKAPPHFLSCFLPMFIWEALPPCYLCAEGRGFQENMLWYRFPLLSVWISHGLRLPFRPHSLPPFSRQQCWSLSSWRSCCTLIFNRPLLLLHLVCGLWTLCGSAAGNSEWVGNLKQKRLCISAGLRFELCSALDTCSRFSGLWFKCSFAGVSVKPKSVLRNW